MAWGAWVAATFSAGNRLAWAPMSVPRRAVQPGEGAGTRPLRADAPYPAGPVPARPGLGDASMAPGVTLTGPGAVLLIIVAAALGAVIDLLLGPTLGIATTIMLAIGAVLAGWLVRRRDLFSVLISPPLVYLLITVVTLFLVSDLGLTLTGLAAALVYGFPAMAIATAFGVLVAGVRRAAGR